MLVICYNRFFFSVVESPTSHFPPKDRKESQHLMKVEINKDNIPNTSDSTRTTRERSRFYEYM